MRDYHLTNHFLAAAWETSLDNDPRAFDAILFPAVAANPETVAQGEVDVVGSLEADERKIEYGDPVPTRAMFLPVEFPVTATDEGDEPAPESEPVKMAIKGTVPRRSVLQFEEYFEEGKTRTVKYYVMKAEIVGQAPAIGFVYYLIPFGESEEVFN